MWHLGKHLSGFLFTQTIPIFYFLTNYRMAEKTFDVEVYTKTERYFELQMTLKWMLTFLENLRDYSFIKIWNEYVNKMCIETVVFEHTELLNDLWAYMNNQHLYKDRMRDKIEKKYLWEEIIYWMDISDD